MDREAEKKKVRIARKVFLVKEETLFMGVILALKTTVSLKVIVALKAVGIMWVTLVMRAPLVKKVLLVIRRVDSVKTSCKAKVRGEVKPPAAAGVVEAAGVAAKAKDDQLCPGV